MRTVDLLVRPVRALLINHALIALEGGADRAADRVNRAGEVKGGGVLPCSMPPVSRTVKVSPCLRAFQKRAGTTPLQYRNQFSA